MDSKSLMNFDLIILELLFDFPLHVLQWCVTPVIFIIYSNIDFDGSNNVSLLTLCKLSEKTIRIAQVDDWLVSVKIFSFVPWRSQTDNWISDEACRLEPSTIEWGIENFSPYSIESLLFLLSYFSLYHGCIILLIFSFSRKKIK